MVRLEVPMLLGAADLADWHLTRGAMHPHTA
jgi:hypothetical protein